MIESIARPRFDSFFPIVPCFDHGRIPNRPPSAADIEYSAVGNLLDLLTLPAKKKIAARNLEQTKLKVADKVLQLAADVQTTFYNLQAQTELVDRLGMILESMTPLRTGAKAI